MVRRGSRAFIRWPHVMQVAAAVFVPTVVEGLALEQRGGRGQVGDGGDGQVVVWVL